MDYQSMLDRCFQGVDELTGCFAGKYDKYINFEESSFLPVLCLDLNEHIVPRSLNKWALNNIYCAVFRF